MPDARPTADPTEPLYAAHLAGLREGVLVAQQCDACGHVQWPPRDMCLACQSLTLGSSVLSGDAVVYTYTVCHRAFHPWFASRVPYAIVVGEVAGGLRFVGGFGGDVAQLKCGLPVAAGTEWVDDAAYLSWSPR